MSVSYAPMSLTMTAMRKPCSLRRMCCRSVVFPEPWKVSVKSEDWSVRQLKILHLPGSPRAGSLGEFEESVIVSSWLGGKELVVNVESKNPLNMCMVSR